MNKQIDIVPIIFGSQSFENSKYLADLLYSLISERIEDYVIIISSDLSHYHNVKRAHTLDYRIMQDIETLQLHKLEDDYFQHRVEACGIGGISTIISFAEMLGLNVKNLKYSHSGEMNGEMNQVVGYLSTLFYR